MDEHQEIIEEFLTVTQFTDSSKRERSIFIDQLREDI